MTDELDTTDQLDQDEPDPTGVLYELSLEAALALLADVPCVVTADGRTTWTRLGDGGHVAQVEGDWGIVHLTESEGELALAWHGDAIGAATFTGLDVLALRAHALPEEPGRAPVSDDDFRVITAVVDRITREAARDIAQQSEWAGGVAETVTVTPQRVTIRYPGRLPADLAAALWARIVIGLKAEGFAYRGERYGEGTVRFVPGKAGAR